MLFSFIKFDLYNGIIKRKRIILIVFLIFFLINFIYTNLIYAFIKTGMILDITQINTGDYIMYYLSGISEYIPDDNTNFPLPFLWMFQCLGCCCFCLYYPIEDLHTSGKYRLLLCGNRGVWWFSKCIWSCVNVMIYYVIAYITSIVASFLAGARMNCSITEYTTVILRLTGLLQSAPYDGVQQFLLVPFVVCVICIMQMTLSLVMRPLYSFVIIACYLLASAYFKVPYLIGNFAMIARSDLIDCVGFSVDTIVKNLVIEGVLFILIGKLIFRNKDII